MERYRTVRAPTSLGAFREAALFLVRLAVSLVTLALLNALFLGWAAAVVRSLFLNR